MLLRILQVLLSIAFISYIGVDLYFLISGFIPSIAILIINMIYAISYLILFTLTLIFKMSRILFAIITFIASFNAGRVSESIISSSGIIGPLAYSHLPLLIGLIIISVLSIILNK